MQVASTIRPCKIEVTCYWFVPTASIMNNTIEKNLSILSLHTVVKRFLKSVVQFNYSILWHKEIGQLAWWVALRIKFLSTSITFTCKYYVKTHWIKFKQLSSINWFKNNLKNERFSWNLSGRSTVKDADLMAGLNSRISVDINNF